MAEKLIACKVCGKEIAQSAKTCPHCGKRNKQPVWKALLKTVLIVIICLVAFSVLLVIALSGNKDSNVPAPATASVDTPAPEKKQSKSTGIWQMGSFVDEFGNKTDEKYISTKNFIKGKFSTLGLIDMDLDVLVAYTDESGLRMQLFEYGRKLGVPAAAIGLEKITVSIQDGKNEKYSLPGDMSQTWLYINDKETIKGILTAGGNIKFRITIDTLGVRSSYSFDIEDSSGFDAIYQQYTETE